VNLLHEPNGYVYGLDREGRIERLDEAGVLVRLKTQIGSDTALKWLRPVEVPFDHESSRFEFLFRAKPTVETRTDGRVKCRLQMARGMALMVLRKHPEILYVTIDYTVWIMTLVRNASPTAISGTKDASFGLDFVKNMQAGISGLVGQAIAQVGLADPGRKLAPSAAPREAPAMDL